MSTNQNKQDIQTEIACLRLSILPKQKTLQMFRNKAEEATTKEYKSFYLSAIAEVLRRLDPMLQRLFELTGDHKL